MPYLISMRKLRSLLFMMDMVVRKLLCIVLDIYRIFLNNWIRIGKEN